MAEAGRMALIGAQGATVEMAPWRWRLGDRLTVQLALFSSVGHCGRSISSDYDYVEL